MRTIVVTGATGTVGSQLLSLLDPQLHTVRAFVRTRPDRVVPGVHYHDGDFGVGASVDAVLTGADTVFLACANSPQQVEYESEFIDRALHHDVRRIVKLSAFGAAADAPVVFWRWHAQIEEHLATSGLPHTVLRPYFFMSNLLPVLAQVLGMLFAPAGQARVGMIDPLDVAAVAARALTDTGGQPRVMTLTGPEALDHHQVAQSLSRVLGRPVVYQEVDEAAAREQLLQSGLPEFVAEQILAIYGCLRDGMQSQVGDSVRLSTGQPPHTLDAYLHRVHDQAHAPDAIVGSP